MTLRIALAAAVFVAASAVPASSRDGRTFEARGHAYEVPDAPQASAAVGAPRRNAASAGYAKSAGDAKSAGYAKSPRAAYVSGKVGTAPAAGLVPAAPATRTINVWGARFEVPAE